MTPKNIFLINEYSHAPRLQLICNFEGGYFIFSYLRKKCRNELVIPQNEKMMTTYRYFTYCYFPMQKAILYLFWDTSDRRTNYTRSNISSFTLFSRQASHS